MTASLWAEVMRPLFGAINHKHDHDLARIGACESARPSARSGRATGRISKGTLRPFRWSRQVSCCSWRWPVAVLLGERRHAARVRSECL